MQTTTSSTSKGSIPYGLQPEQKRQWFEEGYLVLPGFFSASEVDGVAEVHSEIWRTRPRDVVVDDLDKVVRHTAADIPTDQQRMRFKINDLYLSRRPVLDLGLDSRLVAILEGLFVDKPVLINSLSLDYGTQQGFHVDSLFMTPPTPFNLAASWVALEDTHPDAGPLEYYPGSHMITPYKFSDGTNHVINDEMPAWQAYMDDQVKKLGLKKQAFVPKKGDVFIWSAYLLHAGGPIKNMDLTRKSIVFHYFTESSARYCGQKLEAHNGGYWNNKVPILTSEIRMRAGEQLEVRTINDETTEGSKDALPTEPQIKATQPQPGKVEDILRTTLHYVRAWKKDVGAKLW